MAVVYTRLGDLEVARIVPGLMRLLEWQLSPQALLGWIQACMEMGIQTFDHADIYGSYQCEAAFGAALALDPSLRQKIRLVTKCGIALLSPQRPDHYIKHYNTNQDQLVATVERSLQHFRTDWIDVLLIHRPDPLLDADKVAAAFANLKKAGKVLHFGVSNFPPHHFDLLQSRLDFPLVTNQIEFSAAVLTPLHDGTLDQCQKLRIPPLIWSPLGGGGLFQSGEDRMVRIRTALSQVAHEIGNASPEQIALAWVLMHPSRPIAVLGSGKIERIHSAVQAENIQLNRQQWFSIWQASAGQPVP